MRDCSRAAGNDPPDRGTSQKREGMIAGTVSWRRHEGAGNSKHIASLLRKVKAVLYMSATSSRKR